MYSSISVDDFLAYEEVRISGVTNMLNISVVSDLSGLDSEKITVIIKNYTELKKLYIPGAK